MNSDQDKLVDIEKVTVRLDYWYKTKEEARSDAAREEREKAMYRELEDIFSDGEYHGEFEYAETRPQHIRDGDKMRFHVSRYIVLASITNKNT